MNRRLRLERLERRLAPAASVALVTRADPAAPPATPGGVSDLDGGPQTHISADGRYVAYTSTAANVVAGQADANSDADVFLHDRLLDVTILVSHAAGAPLTAAAGASTAPTISADGQYVLYQSTASDLVAGFADNNGNLTDLYLFDRNLGTNRLVSRAASGPTAGSNGKLTISYELSGQGEVAIYSGSATNLIGGYTGSGNQAYFFDSATGTTTLLSHKAGAPTTGSPLLGGARGVSDNGQRILYSGEGNAYVLDRPTGSVTLVSHKYDSTTTAVGGSGGAISADGTKVLFSSAASTVVPGFVDNNGKSLDLYFKDLTTGAVALVTHAAGSTTAGANQGITGSNLSADGSTVAYFTTATNLVGGFIPGKANAFLVYAYNVATTTNVLVSRAAGTSSQGANDSSGSASLSGDGTTVAFTSRAKDLIPGFDNNDSDVYTFHLPSETVQLVSHAAGAPTTSGNGGCGMSWISRDGSALAFMSHADDLQTALDDGNGQPDVYVADQATGVASVVSKRRGLISATPAGVSEAFQVSSNGRYVAFASTAAKVVPGQVDGTGSQDIFLYDRLLNSTMLVSRAFGTSATSANGQSGIFTISRDGRYVAYCSWATDLIPGFVDANGPPVANNGYEYMDIFLFDRLTGTTQLVSRQAGTTAVGGNNSSGTFYAYYKYTLSLSDDGRYVAYTSFATDLIAGFVQTVTTEPVNNAYVFDRVADANTLVSHDATSAVAGGRYQNDEPRISGDGRYVAYAGGLTNLFVAATGGGVILFDLQTGARSLVTHVFGNANVGASYGGSGIVISRDGSYVAYQSAAPDLVGGTDTNGLGDIFLYHRQSGVNTLVSHATGSATTAADRDSALSGAMSDDGRFIAYKSTSGNLVNGFVDNNGTDWYQTDIFLFDRVTGANTLVSHDHSSAVAGGSQPIWDHSISGDGRFVAFSTAAPNIVVGAGQFNNHFDDAFVFDRLSGGNAFVSGRPDGGRATGARAHLPSVTCDGSVIVFIADFDDLVPNDFNDFEDIFAYVTPPPRVQSIQINDGSPQRSVVRSLTVTFDQPVLFAGAPAGAFAVGSVQLTAGSSDNKTFTLTFSGPGTEFGSLADGKYTLTVRAAQVSNIGQLDGNGDGVGGDDYTFNFHRLFGDADGDRTVGPLDFAALRLAFGSPSAAFDFDNDGDADAADFFQFRRRFGVTLP